jgi:copper chaperone
MMALELKVPDMACAVCADKITTAILAIATKNGFNAQVKADPQTKLVVVNADLTTEQITDQVKEAITSAGYTVTD